MEPNKSTIQGKWTELKGEIRKAWGKLTDDELEQTKGDVTAIKGLVEQRYGQEKQNYSERVDEIFNRFSANRDEVMNNIKNKIRQQ